MNRGPTAEEIADAAAERAWAGLDAEADKWAEEVNLTAWIKNIVSIGRLNKNVPLAIREKLIHRQESLIDAFVRQCLAEGFYRGGEGRKAYDEILHTAALKEAIAGAYERAARVADRHAAPVEGEPAKWGQGYTAAAATIAIQIRNLPREHQDEGK